MARIHLRQTQIEHGLTQTKQLSELDLHLQFWLVRLPECATIPERLSELVPSDPGCGPFNRTSYSRVFSCRDGGFAVPEDEQSLPAELSATLAPHLHHALNSPPRRRILRALNATTDAQTLEDLREVVPAASISTLGYHVLVLEMAGCVSAASQIVRANGMLRAYASNVKDSRMVVDLLRATERKDEAPDD